MENGSNFDTPLDYSPMMIDHPHPAAVLAFTVAGLLIGTLAFGLILAVLKYAADFDFDQLLQGLGETATFSDRQNVRLVQGFSHLFMFVFPAWFALWFYKRARRKGGNTRFSWSRDLGLDRFPNVVWLLLGVGLLLISMPFVQYTYTLNKALPLPDWMRMSEAGINDAIKGLLVMDSPLELLTNFLIIAVIPGIGEELLFRGVIQHQFARKMHHWLAIVLSAALFSAIHMQFEGFLPRWILGIVLGWLFWRTDNLWVPILVHLLNNGLQVLGYYFFKDQTDVFDVDSQADIPWWAGLISLALIVGFMYYFNKPKVVKKELPYARKY